MTQDSNMHIVVDNMVPSAPMYIDNQYPILSQPTPAADRNMIKLNDFLDIEKTLLNMSRNDD